VRGVRARVEKKLGGLRDESATVSCATATARVTAPAGLPAGAVVAAVEQAGYAAREPEGARAGGRRPADERDAAYQGHDDDLARWAFPGIIRYPVATPLSLPRRDRAAMP
jgi:P-type Cu+ transporter